jgi:hypothetical protein
MRLTREVVGLHDLPWWTDSGARVIHASSGVLDDALVVHLRPT